MKTLGTLYLIPNSLSGRPIVEELKKKDLNIIKRLKHFIVETPKVARKALADLEITIQDLDMRILDEHSRDRDIKDLLEPLIEGNDIGLMSDAGMPGIADPGSLVVRECHKLGVKIVPLVGPSSIILALAASGMNGQTFSFNGYLPRDPNRRKEKIKQLERESLRRNISQIFIEAPYRNASLVKDILEVCNPNTDFCIAVDITGEKEYIKTQSISDWRLEKDFKILDIPVTYILLAKR
jgi:16S rRNA (cytidine1402-2'-O)-methyltransferase